MFKKNIFVLLFVFGLLIISKNQIYANMWPNGESKGPGEMYFLNDTNLLSANVSVEKVFLLFKTSSKNIFKEKSKYVGYEYLMQKENITKDYILENSINADNYWEKKINEKMMFFEDGEEYEKDGSVNIAVKYYLKNNSDKEIKNEKIGFSFFDIADLDESLHEETDLRKKTKQIYILKDENSYPANIKILDGKNKLNVKDEFILDNFLKTKDKKIDVVKKITSFEVSFKPNEEKTIIVNYSLPLKIDFYKPSYIDYDFSPIYNWKNGKVKKAYIAVIGDDNHILYDIVDNNLPGETKEEKKFDFVNFGKNKYMINLDNLDKTSNVNNIKVYFISQKQFINGASKEGQPGLIMLLGENEEIFPSKDPQKVIFKDGDTKAKEYNIFDLLNTNDTNKKNYKTIDDFELLEGNYAKYQNSIYSRYWILDGIDTDTFEVLNEIYMKDKNSVYYLFSNGIIGDSINKIEGADSKTFEVLKWSYSKDKNFVYYDGKKIEGVDPQTFEILEYGYTKDKNNVYYGGKKIEGVDLQTFEILEYGYTKDKNSVYYSSGNLIKKKDGLDSKTFEILNDTYIKDKNNVYYERKKIEGADSNTFEILKNGYSKDKNSVFYNGIKQEGADSQTFEILKNGYSKDKNYVYYYLDGKKIDGADSKTFEVSENGYSKDKNSVYSDGKKIEGADLKTFEVLKGIYAKDKNNVYCLGEKIEGADLKTFEVLKYGHAKDKNSVYSDGKKIEGADSNTFEVSEDGSTKDKNHKYEYGKKVE